MATKLIFSKGTPLEAVETYFSWRHSQAMDLAKGSFALAGGILTPLLAAILSKGSHVDDWHVALFIGGTLAAAVAGSQFSRTATRLQREFHETVEATLPPPPSPPPPSVI